MFGRCKHIWHKIDILSVAFRICIRCWEVQRQRLPRILLLGWKTIKGSERDEVLRYYWKNFWSYLPSFIAQVAQDG